jgi:hypothetical protein
LVDNTASRARLKSLECETTAPPTTSSIQRSRHHVLVRQIGVKRIRAAKWNARPAQNSHAAQCASHVQVSKLFRRRARLRRCGFRLRRIVMQRPAAERRKAGAENHAGIDQIRAFDNALI